MEVSFSNNFSKCLKMTCNIITNQLGNDECLKNKEATSGARIFIF